MDDFDLDGAIGLLKRRNPLYSDMLDFYGFILKSQIQSEPGLDEKLRELRSRIRSECPLLKRSEFPIDVQSSVLLFRRLLEAEDLSPTYLEQELKKLESLMASDNLSLEQAVLKHSDENFLVATANSCHLDPAVFVFLICKCVQPSLQLVSQYLQNETAVKEWHGGKCPICGSLPLIGEFSRGDGTRLLQCSFCCFKWRVPRLFCIYCGNTDSNSLKYFYAETEPNCRADVCDRCGQYLKSIDSRNFDYDPLLILEDLTTAHLDILAIKKGYSKPCDGAYSPS